MKEDSYNRRLELLIYKKLAECGYKCCEGIDKLYGEYGRLYTNPSAYQHYCHIAYVIRMKYKRKYGVVIKGNKLITKEQYEELISYIDWIFDDFLKEKQNEQNNYKL